MSTINNPPDNPQPNPIGPSPTTVQAIATWENTNGTALLNTNVLVSTVTGGPAIISTISNVDKIIGTTDIVDIYGLNGSAGMYLSLSGTGEGDAQLYTNNLTFELNDAADAYILSAADAYTVLDCGGVSVSGAGYLQTTGLLYANQLPAKTLSTLGSYSVQPIDTFIYCDATTGAQTINLPAATGSGRILTVKKIDSSFNDITIQANGSDHIDGASSQAITTQYNSIYIQDAITANWFIN